MIDSEEILARERQWLWPVGIFFVARGSLIFAAWLQQLLTPIADSTLLGNFCQLDCHFFVSLVNDGYAGDFGRTNFFPGFFLLVRAIHLVVPIDVALLCVLVANAASLASFIVIYDFFCELSDRASAQFALAAFAFYPFAFFHAVGYPESLTVLLTALALRASARGRPLFAALALGAGVLIRHLAGLAWLSLLADAWRRNPTRRAFLTDWRSYTLLLPVAAGLAFVAYCWIDFGSPWAFLRGRGNWGQMAWRGIDAGVIAGSNPIYFLLRSYLVIGLVPTDGTIALLREPRWRTLGWYAASLLLMNVSIGILGFGRYSAECWPAFLPVGVWLQRRPSLAPLLIGVAALLQISFFNLHAHGLVL